MSADPVTRPAERHGAEGDDRRERLQLAELAERGLVLLPRKSTGSAFQGPIAPYRAKLASEMVLEDRR